MVEPIAPGADNRWVGGQKTWTAHQKNSYLVVVVIVHQVPGTSYQVPGARRIYRRQNELKTKPESRTTTAAKNEKKNAKIVFAMKSFGEKTKKN